jgi:hypothetical protein
VSLTPVPGIVVVYHRPDYIFPVWPIADAATVREHIHAFSAHSQFPVWEVNTHFGFPSHLGKMQPSAVFLHYSLWLTTGYLIPKRMKQWLRNIDAPKVAFFQDEFHYCQQRFQFVNDIGVDLIYTHVHPEDIPDVWGRYTPRAAARFNYPGYVDNKMVAAAEKFSLPDPTRDVDVGYRGRPLPAYMGSGALEKSFIGQRFAELAANTGLKVDIDTSEAGRLYGDDWYRFLGRCRAMLGVESGTSYIDLEDEVLHDHESRVATGRDVTLAGLQEGPLGRWDHNFSYRTISPRHFEAAAFRICQVLFEGEYSEVLEPMVHYVPLKKDFSNFEHVVEMIGDPNIRDEIVENAHRDLIRSGRYSYERFVADVDQDLLAQGLDPAIDPRQRAQVDSALRRDEMLGRGVAEMKNLSLIPRLIIARRVRWARKPLRISEESLLAEKALLEERARTREQALASPH